MSGRRYDLSEYNRRACGVYRRVIDRTCSRFFPCRYQLQKLPEAESMVRATLNAYERILGFSMRLLVASFCAFLIGEFTNSKDANESVEKFGAVHGLVNCAGVVHGEKGQHERDEPDRKARFPVAAQRHGVDLSSGEERQRHRAQAGKERRERCLLHEA